MRVPHSGGIGVALRCAKFCIFAFLGGSGGGGSDKGPHSMLQSTQLTKQLDDETVQKIHEKVAQCCLTDVDELVRWNVRWKRCGNWCSSLAKVTSGLALVCDFVAGVYNLKEFVFAAGCTNTVSLVLLSYSNYCFVQAKEKTRELESVLALSVKTVHLTAPPTTPALEARGRSVDLPQKSNTA